MSSTANAAALDGERKYTSIYAPRDLLARFTEVILAEDPDTNVSAEFRRFMRQRIADHEATGRAAA